MENGWWHGWRRALLGCALGVAAWGAPAPRVLAGPAPDATAPAAARADTGAAPGSRADSLARRQRVDSLAIVRSADSLLVRAANAPPETLDTAPQLTVPVFLGGGEIFRVRGGRDGLGPKERAAAIRTRLTNVVRDAAAPADSVRLRSTAQGVEVRVGRYFLWVITPEDIDGLSSADLAVHMAELPGRLRDGILKERSLRRPIGILKSTLLAIGLTFAAWLLARVLAMGGRAWHDWLNGVLPRYLRAIRVRNFEVFSKSQLTAGLGGVLARLDLVLGIVLLYLYLTLVFSLFPWTQGWSWQLLHFASSKAMAGLRSIGAAVPGLLLIVVIVAFFRWLAGLSDRFFDAVASGSLRVGWVHAEVARPSKRIVKIVLWITAAIVAFPYIPGAQTRAFQGVSLFVGVLFSLGSTGIISNIIAGIVLTFSRAFRVGDRVKIGAEVGDVTSLGFFATKLRTIRNEELTLPNGQVASSAIVNYTRLAAGPGLILHTEVTIGYDVDWRKVHALLVEAGARVEGVEAEPAPWVYQRSLNDFHVSYELNCVTRLSHPQLRLYSDLHQEIQDAFARAGIEILSPGYHAIRDGNSAVLPAEPEGPRPEGRQFHLNTTQGA